MKRRKFIASVAGIAGLATIAPTELIAASAVEPVEPLLKPWIDFIIKSDGFWLCQDYDDRWAIVQEIQIEGIEAPFVFKMPINFDLPNLVDEWGINAFDRGLSPRCLDVDFLPQDSLAGLKGDTPYKQIICCFVAKP